MSEHTLNLPRTGPTSSPTSPKPKRPSGKQPPPRVPLDWAAKHGPLTGTLSATTTCAATALTGAATGMPSGWPLVVGAFGALGHGIGASIKRRLTGRSAITRAASWLLAGGWTSWAMTTGPLSWAAAGTLAALGVGIGTMASHAAVHEEAAEQERLSADARAKARELSAAREATAREWEERLYRVCRVRVRVFAVETWSTGAGFSLACELPGGGATWEQLANQARALATDAKLPLGCAIGIEEGDVQGRVVLDVPTENVMAGDYTYPTDYSALSILTGIPWGLRPHSGPVTVFLREAGAVVLGPPGSGKSTFVDVVLAGFARCTDVLTWVIDLKGGAVGIPWVRPWLEAQGLRTPRGDSRPGEDTKPGVDWIASTPAEAKRMLRAALAINEARQRQYQDLMEDDDTTLLPVSARIPQIEIVIDEGAELLSHTFKDPVLKQVQADVKKVMRTTRAMAIRTVLTAVDGNVSALNSTEVKKFSPVGVALTSQETGDTNVSKLFGRVRVDTGQLTAKGTGVIRSATPDGFPATAFKGWKTTPSMAREVALATSPLRTELDAVSIAAAGEDYTGRWDTDRAGWLWEGRQPADDEPNAESDEEADTSSDQGLNLSYKQQAQPADGDENGLLAQFRKEIDAQFDTFEEKPEHTAKPQEQPGLNLSYQQHDQEDVAETDDVQTDGPDWLAEAIDAIESSGSVGMKPATIADMVDRNRNTVREALKAAVERGELVYRDNGPRSVYVHPDHAD